MKVFVCDDSKSDLLRLRHYMEKYAMQEKLDVEIEEFQTAGDLLRAHNAAVEKPVLIFLDIYMNHMDGIEAARRLREAGIKTSILFTTSSQEHALEAFKVHADGYLHKPYDFESFVHAMDKVKGQLQTEYKMIELRIERMNRKFRIKDICFAETDNHSVQIHSLDNVYRANISMEGLKELIGEEDSFVMCGRSFLINLAYVSEMDGENFVMKNQEIVPVPVRLRKQMKEQFQQYLITK